jgi:long-chain acyl-CoA synthetase
MLVQDFLQQSAECSPHKVALICGDRRLTYAEIEAMSNRLAHALIQHGAKRSDRVAIHLHNSIDAVVSVFAALKAGAVFVVINPTTKRDKLTYILNDCEAIALLTDARNAKMSDEVAANVPSLKLRILCGGNAVQAAVGRTHCLVFDIIQADYLAEPPSRISIDLDLACLIYTSGSTGQPKGVMCDHSNVVFATSSIIEYLQNDGDDVVLSVIPMSFDYGLYQVLMVFKFGGTLILERGFAYPAMILKRIAEERVTGFPLVPTIMARLLQMDLDAFSFSSVRYVTNTAAAMPPSHILKFRKKFPHVSIVSMYGLTETKRTLYLPPDQIDKRPGSVGGAIPGTEVWLEDDSGSRLGPDTVGELVIRGRHVMRGYWNDPEATAARYRPGQLPGERVCYSGDLFRMDSEGYFYFVGRKDDIIKTRGEKVAPTEIENVLYMIPGVVEAAVIGVPDSILGEAIKAFVVCPGAPLSVRDVLAHCRTFLEDFMLPKYVEFRDGLPKTPSGKIRKAGLK